MTLPRDSERLTIYLEQTDHRRVADYVEIVERARAHGLAGATVLEGVEGFGTSSRVHRRQHLAIRADAPVVVVIVDTPERIDGFLPEVEPLVRHGLVVRQPVEVVIHRNGQPPSKGAGT